MMEFSGRPALVDLHQSSEPGGAFADVSQGNLSENANRSEEYNPKSELLYDLVVIGAGPGGVTAAREAARLSARVALIERNLIGGARLNVACIPSKTIIRTARLYAEMREAARLGGKVPGNIEVDFAAIMERMRNIRSRLSRPVSLERLREAGIDIYFGEGRFAGNDTVVVANHVLRFAKAVVTTGARPRTRFLPGLAEAGYLTNENIFDLNELPQRLLVIGGGPLGCELAQAFSRFGSKVVIVQDEPMFLPGEERDAAQILSDALARDGVEIHLNTTAVEVRSGSGHKIVDLVCAGDRFSIEVDAILAGVGRTPNVDDLNLAAAGVRFDSAEGIAVDDFLQTSNPKIYAAGDVCLELKFTHVAEASARIALRNALLHRRERFSALTIPWCTYTDPEIAHIGLYVREARERDIPVTTFTILLHDVDRAVTDGEEHGFVKIHVKEGTDQILGATVVARHAGEMINGLSLAITSGIGLRALGRVIHTYPTQADAIRLATEAYDRARPR